MKLQEAEAFLELGLISTSDTAPSAFDQPSQRKQQATLAVLYGWITSRKTIYAFLPSSHFWFLVAIVPDAERNME
ncbi:hypothetical protein SM0020_18117 [Sinorhizobium meliloti CCNWSX0020]|uniref:Uncharacterized protein n=1 Tax=Sinorhizobium meliloti CCNWSX0020 TaxID=1107881 RepID=H0G2D3_RHIML|nr:hypothetical protein SM0020_18117 [Sinorhizobium meliloti CCNWSX0020]